MKRYAHFTCFVVLVLAVITPALQAARTCSGTGDVAGSYTFVAYRSIGTTPDSATPAATVPLTALVAALGNTDTFWLVGVLAFDGSGNVLASSSAGYPSTPVGTYTVGTDCSIAVTLSDTFTSTTTFGILSHPGATLAGMLVDSSGEIDLMPTGTSTAGVSLVLKRAYQSNACSATTLTGPFALTFSGAKSAASGGATGYVQVVRIVADGTGLLVADVPGVKSLQANLQATGTYTVNTDCTGTASLTFASSKVAPLSLSFGIAKSGTKQELGFVLTGTGISGAGLGKAQ